MNTSSIGKRIRKYREAKGWRQEDFAEKTGLSVTYTGMIERGEKVPKLETFITIANVLEVPTDLLLADVLSTGYHIKSSEMTKEIATLSPTERDRIYNVVHAMIQFEKKNENGTEAHKKVPFFRNAPKHVLSEYRMKTVAFVG